MKVRDNPALKLFFLSPIIAELLSGSAPPAEFFNPFGLLILSTLYGGGAILIREARVRWRKGFPVILYLGVAYAIAEEGLFVKSFFDPNWVDLGPLYEYGRYLGVNWVWTVALIIYHSVVSIGVPITLIEVLHREKRGLSWVSDGKLKLLLGAFIMNGVVIYSLLNPYDPEIYPYLLFTFIGIMIVLSAYRFPNIDMSWLSRYKAGEKRLIAAGFLFMFLFYLGFFAMPSILPPALTVIFSLLLLISISLAVAINSLNWMDIHSWAVCFGIILFFIILSPIQEMDPTRMDDTRGMTLVGILILILMLWIRRRVVSRGMVEE